MGVLAFFLIRRTDGEGVTCRCNYDGEMAWRGRHDELMHYRSNPYSMISKKLSELLNR
jgi:hypothetical protein